MKTIIDNPGGCNWSASIAVGNYEYLADKILIYAGGPFVRLFVNPDYFAEKAKQHPSCLPDNKYVHVQK